MPLWAWGGFFFLITAMLAVESQVYLVVAADGSWFGTLSRHDVEAVLAGHR